MPTHSESAMRTLLWNFVGERTASKPMFSSSPENNIVRYIHGWVEGINIAPSDCSKKAYSTTVAIYFLER